MAIKKMTFFPLVSSLGVLGVCVFLPFWLFWPGFVIMLQETRVKNGMNIDFVITTVGIILCK